MNIYPFEVWNWKFNQLTPCRITEWVDGKFVRIHYCTTKDNRETGEKEVTGEYDSFTFLKGIKNVGEWEFDVLRLFPEDTMLSVHGFDIIIDHAEFDKNGDIRLFYKYVQCDEKTERKIQSKFPAWSWINSYGCQFKKTQAGYNFITLKPKDNIVFRSFIPSRLEGYRKTWCFEDPVDRGVIADLERLLGYVRPDGKTWMEWFWENTDGQHLTVKLKSTGELGCIDLSDPKNPIQLKDPKNPEQILSESDPEIFIEKVVEYVKEKKAKNSTPSAAE